MGAIEHLTIALSAKSADRVRARVASGGYADVSAVMEQALAALHSFDDEIASVLPELNGDQVEHWLRTEVIDIYDGMKRDLSRGIPIEDVIAELEAERAARRA